MKLAFGRLYTKNQDFEYNFNNLKLLYNQACNNNVDLIIFPHLAISGVAINDDYLSNTFLKQYENVVEKVAILTENKNCKILLGSIYFEEEYEEQGIKHEQKIFDSTLLIEDGKITSIISRKYFDKKNILHEYKYFDKANFLSAFEFNNKQFNVLLGDDIFYNFNLILAREQKPNYVICLDTSNRDFEFKQKYMVKLSKFTDCPVFYLNTANYINSSLHFDGEMILVNEDNELKYSDLYKDNCLFEFEIDNEDGSELLIKNNYAPNTNNIFTLKTEYKDKVLNVNCEDFSDEYLNNIQQNINNVNFIKFNDNNMQYTINNIININLYDIYNKAFYDGLTLQQQKQLKNIFVESFKK